MEQSADDWSEWGPTVWLRWQTLGEFEDSPLRIGSMVLEQRFERTRMVLNELGHVDHTETEEEWREVECT